jgi:hypothetical protein
LSISDFDSVLPKQMKDPICHLQDLCARIRANGVEYPMTGPVLVAIIRTLCTDPSVSIQYRRIMVNCASANRQVFEIWTAEIASLITAKEAHQEMWATLWRDLARLPRDVMVGIIGSLWEAAPEMSGPFPLILAFFAI